MKEKYGAGLDLKIYTTDSQEAKPYNFLASTNVLLGEKAVPLDIALDEAKMDAFLAERI
jgi:hypothetical protein